MATNTDNYGLIKPDYSDIADIDILNQNSDTIDQVMADTAQRVVANTGAIANINTGYSFKEGTAKNISSGNFVEMLTFADMFDGTGVYLVNFGCNFTQPSSSGTGSRMVVLADKAKSTSSSAMAYNIFSIVRYAPITNSETDISGTQIVTISNESDLSKPWTLYGFHTQSATINNCKGYIEVIKLRNL